MKIELFRPSRSDHAPEERLARVTELFLKCSILLALPLIMTVLSLTVWYFGVFKRHFHFDEHMENIISAAWIPTFGILYSLMTAMVFSTVWSEYKAMRTAVKRYDLETFLDLRDEEISPLVYMMMAVFSLAVLLAFMSLKYPTLGCGIAIVSTTSYLFSLIFLVIMEIDDPCGGIWYIRHIPVEWLEIDVKAWRKQRQERERKKFEEQFKINGVRYVDKRPPQDSIMVF